MSASGFDAHFGLRFALRASTLALVLESPTSTSGFDSNSGGISDFELQGVRLLWSSPSGIDACFGLPCALRRVPSASAGWDCAGTAGGRLNRARTGRSRLARPSRPGSSAVNESCHTFIYCSCSNAEFVRNGQQGIGQFGLVR